MTNFTELNTPAHLVKALERLRITTPTPIQEQAIPLGLEGHDVLGSAQTGTGKTIAYLIPILARLEENPEQTALILTPTRELATQVRDTLIQILGKRSQHNIALLIGGESFTKQLLQLRSRPQVLIGTPGRIIDHLNRNTLRLENCGFLVLDETDRMLDMGFNEQLQELCQYVPEERQTFMFSATIPDNIMKLANKYLTEPKRVSIGSTTKPIEKVQQDIRFSPEKGKFDVLTDELDTRDGSIIVFVKTKRGADELVIKLQHRNYKAVAIHGDLRQHKRDRVIREFRNKRHRIMVATDIAARGLDIPHIEHVVNYDLPQCPEDFIHRIGRTGRADAIGQALTVISPRDGFLWSQIHDMMHPGKPCEMPEGYDTEPRGRKRKRSSNASKPAGGFKPRGEFREKKRTFKRDESGETSSFRDKPFRPKPAGSFKPRHEERRKPRPSMNDEYGDVVSFDERPMRGKPSRFKSDRFNGSDSYENSDRPARKSFDRPQERSKSDRFNGNDSYENSDRPARRNFDKPQGRFKSDRFNGNDGYENSDRPARKNFDKPQTGFKKKRFSDSDTYEPSDRPARSSRPNFEKPQGGFKKKTEGRFKPRFESSSEGEYQPKKSFSKRTHAAGKGAAQGTPGGVKKKSQRKGTSSKGFVPGGNTPAFKGRKPKNASRGQAYRD